MLPERDTNPGLISFVIIGQDDDEFAGCIDSIKKLRIPDGLAATCIRVPDAAGFSSAAQQGMLASDAKYKVYVHETVRLEREDFLASVIEAFSSDKSLGLLGVIGTKCLYGRAADWGLSPVGSLRVRETGETHFFERDRKAPVPVAALFGGVVATQYDVPWRTGLFRSEKFSLLSAALEHRRMGFTASVLPQRAVWASVLSDTARMDFSDEDVFRAEYAPELSGEEFCYPPGHHFHPQIEHSLDSMRAAILKDVRLGRVEESLRRLSSTGNTMYVYNQFLRDESMESAYLRISELVSKLYPEDVKPYEPDENCVLFYDGFGLDVRGLAQVYLRGLAAAGFDILYVTSKRARGTIPSLEKILSDAPGSSETVWLSEDTQTGIFREIAAAVMRRRPKIGILYSSPWDGPGILAFTRFSGIMRRFIINLTDHAYWPGLSTFDRSIEFRNFGASTSYFCRRIPKEKILVNPYYPAFDPAKKFEGFPFTKKPGDFVVFSGGSLYKTYDESMTYYGIVDWLLKKFRQVIFWYAGFGDDSGLRALMGKYPGRVIYTPERSDLFQVMENIDMYLSTYPMGGGLMMQYSAVAGKAPMTMLGKSNRKESGGILLDQENVGVIFDGPDDLKRAITRYIGDKKYRASLQKKLVNSVVSRETFEKNLAMILREEKSLFPTVLTEPDLTDFQRDFFMRFIRDHTSSK